MSYFLAKLMDMAITTCYDYQNDIYDVNIYDDETNVNINITNKYKTDPTKGTNVDAHADTRNEDNTSTRRVKGPKQRKRIKHN